MVTAHATPGGGATFRVELPLEPVPPDENAP
jgi:signal transduction histidine kinase